MRTIKVGTIDLFQVQEEIKSDLALVQQAIRQLVDSRPFGEHSEQDLLDYVNLRHQEEQLKGLL